MEAVAAIYLSLIKGNVQSKAPETAFHSSVSCKRLLHVDDLGAEYWVRNLICPVRFSSAVSNILTSMPEPKTFLEIGPHSALAGPIRQILISAKSTDTYLNVLTRGKDSHAEFLRSMGELWLSNYPVYFSTIAGDGAFLNDLPRYPWHYEGPLWNESRLAREYRLREFPHHELLGSRVLESTPLNPSWRNLLRLESVPWIKEHEVAGSILMPGVGFFCMAGEAIRQITGDEAFSLRKVHICAPLMLTEDAATEIVTQLSRESVTSSVESDWYYFDISSYQSNGTWTKHAFGQVCGGCGIDCDRKSPDVDDLPRICSSRGWYRQMRTLGLEYGGLFMGLRDMTAHPNMQKIVAFTTNHKPDAPARSKYAIHPATLDCLPQGLAPAMTGGLTRLFTKAALPTYVEEFYVRPPPSAEMKIMVEITEQRQTSYIGHAVATCQDEVVVEAIGYQLSIFGGEDDEDKQDSHAAAELVWKEDINLLYPATLIYPTKDRNQLFELLDEYGTLNMLDAEDRLQQSDIEPTRPHLEDYKTWLKGHANLLRGQYSTLLTGMDAESQQLRLQDLYSQLRSSEAYAAARAIKRISTSCQGIFDGTIDEYSLLVEDNVIHGLYDFVQYYEYSALFELIAHRQPNLRVLEIGAGTGGTTATILPALVAASGQRLYQSYTYTDVSSSFFISAKERFKGYEALEFAVLDISKDPEEQGFELGSYDLIVASNV